MEPEKPSFFSTRFIRFLGGKNLLFGLVTLLFLGCILFIYQKVSFIFYPIIVFLQTVVLPVILATIAYYLLRPILRILEKWKIPRVWGILIIYLGLAGLITLLVILVFPFLKGQFTNLINEFPQYFMEMLHSIQTFVQGSTFNSYLTKFDFNLDKAIGDLTKDLSETVKNTVGKLSSGIATGITGLISTLTGILLALVTVPFILFYLLKDGEKLPKFVLGMFPPRMRDDVAHLFKQADRQISSYIQGQIIVSFCIGVMITIGFLIIGMDYALVLGVLAMVTSVVPYLGPIIAITPAAIIAIVTSPFMLVKLAVVWTVVQLIEGKFISPQVMGKSLHVHPITIIFVLLTAGSLFGVPGVVLGIPGYAVIKVLVSHLFYLYKKRYNRHEPDPALAYKVEDWKDE
ncbi:AI-2E family transporter [Viridibacillus sp. YIM B01967]|uniref:AI-2E family transporter n=1 Tax=Viridibacillus soli TaxID=2798301 RepID=A0ABS1H2W2_9BACL|nr:AI-2E family transporter [Viridibacillus soli]MBK3493744.1 AI-2E family transporter [Viridibacillus soli]